MNKIIQLANFREDTANFREDTANFRNPQTGRIYSIQGISPTLNTCQGESDNLKWWL